MSTRRRLRPALGFLLIVAILLVGWEAAKLLAGDPWRFPDYGFYWDPPLRWKPVNDLNLPHLWTIFGAFWELDAKGETYISSLIGAAFFTARESALGFALGTGVGLGLAIVLIPVEGPERGPGPLLVASQAVPIIAIAPVVVVGLRAGWFGVAIVATYLTFFPVTIAAIRGMRSAGPPAFPPERSCACGAESRAGIRDGLGGARLQAMQYYSFSPQDLWAAIAACAALGIVAFLLVVTAERIALRGYRPTEDGARARQTARPNPSSRSRASR